MERTQNALSDTERIDWLRLIRSRNVGPHMFIELIDCFGTAAAAIDALPELSRPAGGRRKFTILHRDSIVAEFEALKAAGGTAIGLYEPDYPETLAAIADPPPVLFLRGDVKMLKRPTVGIVGARNASANGRSFAEDVAGQLGKAGYVVVSGLARGIDATAHMGRWTPGRLRPSPAA
jgi:DNA processing protein